LDRADVFRTAEADHQRMGREIHRVQVIDVEPGDPGILLDGRLGVDLLHDPLCRLGVRHHHLLARSDEVLAAEDLERPIRPQER